MNTDPNAIKILCYGDSNTWGYIPGRGSRYPANIRWTALLQKKLGDDYWVIEEGLNSRTTDLDDTKKVGKNGFTYLRPCLETHNPFDVIILFLGTNDMKERYHREAEEIGVAIKKLLDEINLTAISNDGETPDIILISPPIVDESVAGVEEKYKGAEIKSRKLGKIYKKIAKEYKLKFIDLAQHVLPSKRDGYHLEPKDHQKLADLFFEKIKE